MPKRWPVGMLVVVLAMALGAGCSVNGDDSAGPSGERASAEGGSSAEDEAQRAHAELVQQVEQVCVEASSATPGGATTAFDTLSDLTTPHVADARLTNDALKQLDTLTPSDDDRAAFDAFDDAMGEVVDANIATAQAKSLPAFQQGAQRTVRANVLAFEAADELGLTEKCPPRSTSSVYSAALKRFERTGGSLADNRPEPPGEPEEQGPPPAGQFRLLGRFEGVVRQFGPRKKTDRYRAILTLRDLTVGDVGGRILYPKFDCSGPVIVSQATEDRAVLRERLTKNADNCLGSGALITVTPTVDGISFRWRGRSGNDGVETLGQLKR